MPAAARSIIAFHTGTITVRRGLLVGGEGALAALEPCTMPILCFAVELGQGDGWVLVESGLEDASPFAGGLRGAAGALLARARFEPAWALSRRLADAGIARERIRAVVLTHLDFDHTGGLRGLADRPVYVSRAEWRHGLAPPLLDRIQRRQRPADFRGLQRVQEVDFVPDRALPFAAGARDLPEAAGAMTLVSLPGHAAGHMGALVRLEGGERTLLCGDACYAAEHVIDRRPFGPMPRLFACDLAAAERTLDALRRWKAAEPDLRVVPTHDPWTGAVCAHGPAAIAGAACVPGPIA